MVAHLPILQVVVPLVAAPLCALLRRSTLAWALALAASTAAFVVAAVLLDLVLAGEDISYAIGGWDAPWGIEYRVDLLNAFVLLIVAGIGAVVLVYARTSFEQEIPAEDHALFYAAYMGCLAGLLGSTITGDAFNVFVCLEVS
jgi:multicomponent Na+:H+ antiporter subunit D